MARKTRRVHTSWTVWSRDLQPPDTAAFTKTEQACAESSKRVERFTLAEVRKGKCEAKAVRGRLAKPSGDAWCI
jgi:hypothetical protein